MELFFIYIFLAIVMGVFGGDRKIGFWGAFFLSLLLSPLIGLIFVLLSPSKNIEANQGELVKNSQQQTEILQSISQTSYIDSLHKLKELYESKLISLEDFEKEKEMLETQRGKADTNHVDSSEDTISKLKTLYFERKISLAEYDERVKKLGNKI